MKIREFLKSKETEDKAANLRVWFFFLFIIGVAVAFVCWLFRKCCTVHVGLCWYNFWGIPYHIGRFVGTVAFLGLIIVWGYLLLYSFWDNFSPNGSAMVFYKRAHHAKNATSASNDTKPGKAKPGDADWSLDYGDLDDFD